MDRRVMIGDLAALERFADFDPAYLGSERTPPGEQRLSAVG
jgi:hypothetical protein